MSDSGKVQLDKSRISKAALSGVPLSITTYTLSHDMEIYITSVLEAFLQAVGQVHLKEYLSYCIQELAVNAKKANTKRVYFKEKGLNISNLDDYKKGMENFKSETLSNIVYYLKKQREEGLYVKVVFQVKHDSIIIEIKNNSEMLACEYVRIHDKLARSKKLSSVGDSLSQILDDSEGAGLGLVIIMQMLKKIGLTEDNYEIIVNKGETITRLTVPIDVQTKKNIDELSSHVVSAIEAIPPFPENIQSLQVLLNDPDSKMSDIAKYISTDAGLIADLLKFVNSAAFAMGKSCNNITEAVKMVGIKGLKGLLYSYGTQKILGSITEQQRSLWRHSYKTAYFAYNLARNFGKNPTLLNDIYTCGILHDMGKIVFSNLHPDLVTEMGSFCAEKKISKTLLESLIAGNDHAEIGAKLAEHWNFPDNLIWSIRYHHSPELAPCAVKTLVSIIYVANAMCNYLDEEIDFYQLDKDILMSCSIENEATFRAIASQLNAGFSRDLSK